MDGKTLVESLRSGRRVYGTLIVSPSPKWPSGIASAGLDFVFIDTEHVPIDRAQLSWMCETYRRMGLAPLVRIPAPDPYRATMVLDGGAAGVIAPYVESPEQVKALRGAVKFRPLKGRRLQETLDGEPLEPALAEYLRRRNEGSALVVNIESAPAIAALDEILAVGGLDAVLVGPHDLSCSLGLPEQYEHPKFIEAVRTIFSKAAGVGAGIHSWSEVDRQIEWLRAGANLLIHSGDLMLVAKHLAADLRAIRRGIGDDPAEGGQGEAVV